MFSLIDTIIVRPITNILFFIYNYVGDFGLAIILFVIIVKLCMWPLVKRQLHQTKLMRQLQPELKQIKKNCAGNRQLESLQTMELYKKYNVKPFRSILSLIIQLPMFIAIFGAIRVMVTPPTEDSNLDLRAYSFVKQDNSNIKNVIDLQTKFMEETSAYNTAKADNNKSEEEKNALEAPVYEFHPRLFNLVNLEANPGFTSASAIFALALAVLACFVQYLTTKQLRPSGNVKGKGFRQLLKEAGEGKELDQAEINDMTSAQMGTFMPIMLLLIMINLPGALILYYFLSNLLTFVQQKIVLNRAEKEMEISADKAVLKELKDIQEAEVIKNKKTGTKITRISVKDNKKKRR